MDSLPKCYRTHSDIVTLVESVRLEIRRLELEMDKGCESGETGRVGSGETERGRGRGRTKNPRHTRE